MNFRHIGQQDYLTVWQQMKTFTLNRTKITEDECWFVEHPPVYTQGQAGKAQHIINPKDIPIVQSDRGGQVTYHGPGQLVVYVLFDLSRTKLGIRTLVNLLEQTLIELLNGYQISATTRCQAPGVYVNEQKIASIGLRVKSHCTYHGFALNVDMDLTPFKGINPCGFENMEMTQMKNFVAMLNMTDVTKRLQTLLAQSLNV